MADGFPASNPPVPEPERTYVRPRPGARGPARPPADTAPDPTAAAALPAQGVSSNPLLACTQPLFAAIAQMRAATTVTDPVALKNHLSQLITDFEREAYGRGIAKEDVIATRYVLCTFLDEVASTSPWGAAGTWSGDPLLVRFHNEAYGGEKVFLLLSKLAETPERKRDLLELIHLCLALGFEGKYRVVPGGRAQLEQLRERLFQLLRQHRPAAERDLSPVWHPAQLRRRRLIDGAPLWALVAVAGAVMLITFLLYTNLLAGRSDTLFAAIQDIRFSAQPAPAQVRLPAPRPRLAQFLEPEIRKGLVAVRDEANRSVVTITGDVLFEPGSAQLAGGVLPTLDRVGRALAETPGRVLVSGHSDNQPIRTARFPSNWHLSQERARAVSRELGRLVPAQRIESEGRADQEPIAPNDSAAGRARNRRVEITLFTGQ